ncbi:cytochrome b [Sideroxyarcus sp. TK5]
MTQQNTQTRYSLLSIGLHWLMLLVFIGVYGSIELRELFEKGSDPREMLKSWHFMLGILLFVLIWPRIAARLSGTTPAVVPEPEKIQQLAAKLLHLALYVLMIAMPISGYLLLSAACKPIPFFGLELPALIDTDKELAKQIKEVHELVGSAGYFLIGAHFVAALYHHFIVRDNTMTRMLPEKK